MSAVTTKKRRAAKGKATATKKKVPTASKDTGDVKECPRCGSKLFSDMDVCYGCLYDFSRQPESDAEEEAARINRMYGVGEMFEDIDEPWDEGLPPLDYDLEPEPEPWSEPEADSTLSLVLPGALRDLGPSPRLLIRSNDLDVAIPFERTIFVGRGKDNDIVLHSRAVSRKHVRIIPLPEGATVESLGATNPAMLCGRPVEKPMHMARGDTLSICGTMLTLVGAVHPSEDDGAYDVVF